MDNISHRSLPPNHFSQSVTFCSSRSGQPYLLDPVRGGGKCSDTPPSLSLGQLTPIFPTQAQMFTEALQQPFSSPDLGCHGSGLILSGKPRTVSASLQSETSSVSFRGLSKFAALQPRGSGVWGAPAPAKLSLTGCTPLSLFQTTPSFQADAFFSLN